MPEKAFPSLKPLDFIVLLVAAAVAVVSGVLAASSGDASTIRMTDGTKEWLYPIGTDRTVDIAGPLGVTVVTIKDGKAHIHSSPCPNQTCVAAAAISSPGQWIACLPNRVLVSVEGEPETEAPDAIVR